LQVRRHADALINTQQNRLPLEHFTVKNFRCLKGVGFAADPQYNLIHGPNASGKTSVLEALAYLGRGKSFRGASPQQLVCHGEKEFLLLGKVRVGARLATVGVRNGKEGLEAKIDGRRETSAAALVEILPLQIIDPEIHGLVAGSPEKRRQYLDWVAFHVEHGYADRWRRFRRALRQRNAALRDGASRSAIAVWDQEFLEAAEGVDRTRCGTLKTAGKSLERTGAALLGSAVNFEYRRGWAAEQSLEEALAESWERDRLTGSTQMGPQRAELRLIHNERQARRLVSRGQQKLLACTMILAATEVVQAALGRPLLLLLDDPAAELDEESLDRLMTSVFALGCQVIATSLEAERLRFPERPAMFHVKHGRLQSAVQ
jgi:DNA replication and repair protein RecF